MKAMMPAGVPSLSAMISSPPCLLFSCCVASPLLVKREAGSGQLAVRVPLGLGLVRAMVGVIKGRGSQGTTVEVVR